MIEFELAPEYPSRTVGQLINLFYKYNTFKEGKRTIAAHPLGFVSNPVPFVMPDDPFAQDIWVAVFSGIRGIERARYYVTIESNFTQIHGPHATKLCLQVYPGERGHPAKLEWLASAQIMANFYNEDKIISKLRRIIRLKEFFATEHSMENTVLFDHWEDEGIQIS